MSCWSANYIVTCEKDLESSPQIFRVGKTILPYNCLVNNLKKMYPDGCIFLLFRSSKYAYQINLDIKKALDKYRKFDIMTGKKMRNTYALKNLEMIVEKLFPIIQHYEAEAPDFVTMPTFIRPVFLPLRINDFYSIEEIHSANGDILSDLVAINLFNEEKMKLYAMQNQKIYESFIPVISEQIQIWKKQADNLESKRIEYKKRYGKRKFASISDPKMIDNIIAKKKVSLFWANGATMNEPIVVPDDSPSSGQDIPIDVDRMDEHELEGIEILGEMKTCTRL